MKTILPNYKMEYILQKFILNKNFKKKKHTHSKIHQVYFVQTSLCYLFSEILVVNLEHGYGEVNKK